jgi:UDP-glucose 6-dehydrogenase
MIKNNMNYLEVMVLSSFLVGAYQLPLIENTLNKYGYENNINEKITFSKNFQQLVEDQKIAFSSLITQDDEKDDVLVSEIAPIQKTITNTVSNANSVTPSNNTVGGTNGIPNPSHTVSSTVDKK